MAFTLPPPGDTLIRKNLHLENLRVTAQDAPDFTVQISAGSFWTDDITYIEYAGGNSPALAKPLQTNKVRLVVVGLDLFGNVALLNGTDVTSNPDLPTITPDFIPLAAVLMQGNTTSVTDDLIHDIRQIFSIGADITPISISGVIGLTSQLDVLTASTGTNSSTILVLENNVSTLQASVTANASAITVLQASVLVNSSAIAALGNTSALQASVTANASSITVLQADVLSNTSSINTLGNTSALNASIAANASAIIVLQASVAQNASAISGLGNTSALQASITANASSIVVLQASVTTLDGARASNAPLILDNASAIGALETLTVSHTNSLASAATIYNDNASAITVLEGARASNAPLVLDNASAIAVLELPGDASTLQGMLPSISSVASTIVARDASGDIRVNDSSFIIDGNGNELLQFVETGGATHYLRIRNTASVNPLLFTVESSEADGPLTISSKGDGNFNLSACTGVLTLLGSTVTTSGLTVTEVFGPVYDIAGTTFTQPTASSVIMRFVTPRAFTIPSGFTNSRALSGVAASASQVYNIKRFNASAVTTSVIGTITWAVASTNGIYADSGELAEHPFVIGDILSITAPGTQDGTHDELSWTIVGTTT